MRRPNIFLYSLLLPAMWVCCSLIFTTIAPGKRLIDASLLFMGVASLISWIFARRQKRDFNAAEYRNIILYCIGWTLFLEFISLLFLYFFPPAKALSDLSARTLCLLVLFAVTVDSLFVWLAFKKVGRRVIKAYLAKFGEAEIKPEESKAYDAIKPVFLFYLALVASAALAFSAAHALHIWMANGKLRLETMQSAYRPNPRNENSITVAGWGQVELDRLLVNFMGTYGLPPSAVAVASRGDSLFKITFPNDIEPRYFFFLINYLRYPKEFDVRNRTIGVVGHARLGLAFGIPDSSLDGMTAKIYIPANDKEYDNVYVQSESGKAFKVPLSRLIWEPVDDPRIPIEIRNVQ